MPPQAQVKKVGGVAAAKTAGGAVAAAAKAKTPTAEKPKGLQPFDITTSVGPDGNSVVGEDGKLTAVPSGWDRKKHKPLTKDDFVDEATFAEFRAEQIQQLITQLQGTADKYKDTAANLRKFGDPEKRKALKKMEAMATQYLALQAALSKDGATDLPTLADLIEKAQAKQQAGNATE